MESGSNTTDMMNTQESPINQLDLQLGDIVNITKQAIIFIILIIRRFTSQI